MMLYKDSLMADNPARRLLVTGANGHLGRRVVELLLQGGHDGIVAASRSPAQLTDLVERGGQSGQADFDRQRRSIRLSRMSTDC